MHTTLRESPGAHRDLCTQWVFAGTGVLYSRQLNLRNVCTTLMTTHVQVKMQVSTH